MILTYSKRAVDGENTAIRISMNGLLRASRKRMLVDKTEGNRYNAKCIFVHDECAFQMRIWVVPQIIFSLSHIFVGWIFYFFKEEQI